MDPRSSNHPEWRQLKENHRRAFLAFRAHLPVRETVKEIKSDSDADMYSQFLSKLMDYVCASPKLFEADRAGRDAHDAKTIKLHEAIDAKKEMVQATLQALEMKMIERDERIPEKIKKN